MMIKNFSELRMIFLILKRLVVSLCVCSCFFFSFWFGKLFWFSFWKKLFGIWKCLWDNRLGLFFFCSGVNCWGFMSIFTTIEDLWVGFGWCFLELRRLRMIRWWVLGFMMWGINSDIVCFILGMWFCRLEVILRC